MKNIIICVLVGLSFLTSGFWVGLRFAPMPKKPAPVAAPAAALAASPLPPKEAFSLDALQRASQNMQSVNDALQAREQAVTAREKAVAQKEDELVAERAALDRVHAHFKQLYAEFQDRLQLVSDTQTGALERQVTIFNSMDPLQSVDLVRSLDDPTVTRLFALMEDKPLAKLVGAWKQKYPMDTVRLLTDLNGIGRVVAKDKIDLPDNPPAADTGAPAPPASSDVSTPPAAATPDSTTPDASAPAPAATPDANTAAAPDSSATPPAAPADPNTPPAPPADGTIGGHEPYANAGTPPPDLGAPTAPPSIPEAPSPAAIPSAPDMTTPVPAAAPSDSTPAAPTASPQDSTPAGASGNPASASTDSSLLDSPGETAAKAAARVTPGDEDNAPAPSEFTQPTPATRPAIDRPARFASARNN
jgi:hypothetical protein